MAGATNRRWVPLSVAAVCLVAGAAVVAYRAAVSVLRDEAVKALGPEAEIARVQVGWSGVEVEGLRIKGAGDWPATDTLRAKRIVIVPNLRSLVSDHVHVRSITVFEPYLSASRSGDGRMTILPTLLTPGRVHVGTHNTETKAPATTATIDRIHVEGGVLELYDASVRRPPLKIRFENIDSTVENLVVPTLAGRTELDFTATVKGPAQDGTVTVSGWANVADNESETATTLRGADLTALQPYLVKPGEISVRRGTLDLDLESAVVQRRLHAPGHLTISGLELGTAEGALGTFMGVPRNTLLAFMKNQNGKITVSFVLEGDVDNPRFSLNEALSTRVALSAAQALGITIGGVATTAESLGRTGVDAAGKAGTGVGSALKKLFGGSPSHGNSR